jgi:hypothetical protein
MGSAHDKALMGYTIGLMKAHKTSLAFIFSASFLIASNFRNNLLEK